MAIYELEERILFDGAIPADVADVQEQSSEDTESADVENNTADSADASTTSGTENVSIAPDSAMTSSDSADTDDSDSDDETAESSQTSDSTPQSTADNSLSDLDIALDGLSDITFPDGYIPNPNIVLISSDHSELGEITDALNDGTILVEYNSDASFDSIIQLLRTELGDARPVNIAIINNYESGITNYESDAAAEFISDLNSIRTYDGEINVVSFGDNEITNYELQITNDGEVTIAEDADGNLSDYFDTSAFQSDSISELYIVDRSVSGFDRIVSEIPEGSEIIYIDSVSSGINQISEALNNYSEIDSLHIFTEGNYRQIMVGGDVITQDNIGNFKGEFSSWQDNLSQNADILFYGCSIAKDEVGQGVIGQIAEFTGADIAASDDYTGISGDWDLEFNIGSIESETFQVDNYES